MANTSTSRSGRQARRQHATQPRLEPLEERALLANSFLQGIAYRDANLNDQFDANDPRQAGARIELFRGLEQVPFAVRTTDSAGYYLFADLPPGDYRLVETPPAGFDNQSANAFSQINPVTVPPGTRNTLRVSLLDPERMSSSFQGLFAHRLIPANGVRLFGEVPPGFTGQPGEVGQFRIEVERPGLPPVEIRSLCVTLAPPALDWPGGRFVPRRIQDALPDRGAQIGYLFNRYGVRTDLTNDQGAGLQMAVWEMIYDTPSNDPWNTGNFRYVLTDPQILAAANFYLADSVGRSEPANYLASVDPFLQSFLATNSLNFGNRPLAAIAGHKWHDLNADGLWNQNEVALSGWTIQLLQNNAVVASATTGANGQYRMENLIPGAYTVREVVQDGWVRSYPGGAGTHTVTLAPGQNFQGPALAAVSPNFGNYLPGSMSGQVTHQSPECVGVTDRGGQASVRIVLERQVNGQFQFVTDATTNASGMYSFANLTPGTYRVNQVVQGWTELSRPSATFVLTSGQTLTGQNFRNQLPLDQNLRCGSLSGQVTYQTPTCTGVEDRGGRANVRVFVDVNRNDRFDAGEPAVITDARGGYQISDLGRGNHRVRIEVVNSTWTVLGPAFRDVVQETPIFNVSNLNFRLQLPPDEPLRCGSFAGLVTQQIPTCTQPEDRGGRAGVTVFLDTNNNGRLDTGEPRTVTDAAGRYTLAPLGAGNYRVRPVLETGWQVLGPAFRDVQQSTPTFTITGLDFRVEVPAPIPLICEPPRDVLATFGGTIPAILSSILGGKSQLLASSFIRGTETGGATALAGPAFITGLYRQLLNRSPDVAGQNLWVRQLDMGVPRSQIVAAFWNSEEHRRIEVEFYYQTYLGRTADPAGRDAWVAALQAGLSEKELLARFLAAPEFAARSAGDDATYVARLYASVLGRQAEMTGFTAWVQAIQTGTSREAVALAFLDSREVSRRVLDQLYRNFFDRGVDAGGELTWLTALGTRRATWGSVAQALLASDEYAQRVHNLARGTPS